MAEDIKTYQPHWGEKKKKHYHHHHTAPNEKNRGLGGSLRMRDKQAYYGLMLVLITVLSIGAYKVVMMYVKELREIPNDDPNTEMSVDELRIHKVEEKDALIYSDSLAQTYQFDSAAIHRVQIETRPVYRPPRKENAWYITNREWKSIWKNYQRWKWQRNKEREEKR